MVVRRDGGLDHRTFADFPSLLRRGDVLVLNETRVLRARLLGTSHGGGAAEVLLLRPLESGAYDPQARRWTALVRPGRRLRAGATVRFGVAGAATIRRVREDGVREVELSYEGSLDDFLERAGEVPLPPYVGHASARARDGYQTVFARVPGSVAAPTASLHFTDAVFERLRERGVAMHKLTLDVGLGTFKPIGADRIDDHVMHAEHYAIPTDTAEAISAARAEGRRVIAAGTTVVRALEGAANLQGEVPAGTGEVNLYITPGYEFRVVDALLTNFHLPRSSLLVLVGAFAGRARMARAYAEAIRERYRFFSFGDAMFTEREASARTAQGMS